MIGIEKAFEIIRSVTREPSLVTVALDDALGRVLAREVFSPIDSPPFDKSAMDGFAVGGNDRSIEFHVLETVAAGGMPTRQVRTGECARIMTGAMLPQGAGRVIRKEFVEENGSVVRQLQPESGDNVVRRGDNLRAGDSVLQPKVIRPQDIGILAASGIARVEVANPPIAGIMATGSEIRPAGEPLGAGQIYNSNGPQLRAQLSAMRCPCLLFDAVEDEPGPLSAALASALAACDVVLLTGGVSEGDFDYVPRCLSDLGADILFHGVAIKPGKPTLLARQGGKFVFGLPGNPVSTFVVFEVLARPLLYRMMGIDWSPALQKGELAEDVRRKNAERDEFLPVQWTGEGIRLVKYHGSAHLNALGAADGLIRVPRGVGAIEKGTVIDVRPI